MDELMKPPSRYDTDEKRKKHAEYQKKWRAANADKVKLIDHKSRENEKKNPERTERRKVRLKADRKKPLTLKRRQAQKTRRYQKTQDAINSNRRWSDFEIEMAFSRVLTDTEIGIALGRSVMAVGLARIRYKERAPIGWTQKS